MSLDPKQEPSPTTPSDPPAGASWAHLFAWLTLGMVNAGFIAVAVPRASGSPLGVRALHHAYGLGHMTALGLVSMAVAAAWQKWGPRHKLAAPAALGGGAFGLALLLFGQDLAGFLERHAASGGKLPWYLALCTVAGAGMAAIGLIGRAMSRPAWRWGLVVGGLAVGIANHLVLAFNYPGAHLFTAWAAALLLASGFGKLRLPEGRTWAKRPYPHVALAVVSLAVLPSLLVPPRSTVWRELFRAPGSVLAPFLARVLPERRTGDVPAAVLASPWFSDRSHAAAVPPHTPRLVPTDAIVILITVDALRSSVVADGAYADRLPAFEALRRESVEFSTARAPSPSTITSIASMFTGKHYTGLCWTELKSGMHKGALMPWEDPSKRLAELLSAGGVRTVQMVQAFGLAADAGVGNGFQEEIRTTRTYAPASELMDRTIKRLSGDLAGPTFMYMHFIDSHAPYDRAGTAGTEHDRYLGELVLVDRQLGRLRKHLDDAGLADRAVLLLSADHGEAFGEHGTHYHAVTVYEEMVRIPLLVRLPGQGHRVVDEPVSLMDVGPTVLDLFGLPTPGQFLAQSLTPLLRGAGAHLDRPIAVDAGRRMQALYCADGLKAIVDLQRKTREVYDLKADPKEERNLVDTDPARSERCLATLRAFFEAHELRKEGYQVPWRQF